jgi:ferredoxin
MLPGHPEKCGLCAAACSFAALLARTAASSYAAASLSIKEMAPAGQAGLGPEE